MRAHTPFIFSSLLFLSFSPFLLRFWRSLFNKPRPQLLERPTPSPSPASMQRSAPLRCVLACACPGSHSSTSWAQIWLCGVRPRGAFCTVFGADFWSFADRHLQLHCRRLVDLCWVFSLQCFVSCRWIESCGP